MTADAKPDTHHRFAVLDGWRALSILAVLAGHWLPLGPSEWQMNAAVAASGMALFFCLSGFLITHFLLKDDRVFPFVVKRLSRIVPLSWMAVLVLIVTWGSDWRSALANLLFFANSPSAHLLPGGHHLWSLCVEMQFYAFMALLIGVGGRRTLNLLPIFCILITALRVVDGEVISIVTWHRVDEILVGGCVALWWHRKAREDSTAAQSGVRAWLPIVALIGLVVSANPHTEELGYLRPYFAAFAVGSSLIAFPAFFQAWFTSAGARYIASISYALYVVHGVLTETWLGGAQSDILQRYILRPPLAAATWFLAHLSTRFFEEPLNKAARNYLRSREARSIFTPSPGNQADAGR